MFQICWKEMIRAVALLAVLNSVIVSPSSHATNSLRSVDSLQPSSNRTLVSPGDVFELGFFSSSNRWYIGIWYKNIAERTYVWVANRDNPLLDSNGTFSISDTNLVIRDQVNTLVWSSKVIMQIKSPVVAELLANGNFVLRSIYVEVFLWESFDYPTDCLIPEMKLGLDTKNISRVLTSWKSLDDPSSGDYTLRLEFESPPQLSILYKGQQLYSSGPWDGDKFTALPPVFEVTQKRMERTCSFLATNNSVSRLELAHTGLLIQFTWNKSTTEWDWSWNTMNHICEIYNVCGSYAYCDAKTTPFCNCIEGFETDSTNMVEGCVRKTPLKCGEYNFIQLGEMSFPKAESTVIPVVTNEECIGFAVTHSLPNGKSDCYTWRGELLNLRRNSTERQSLYIKLAGKKKKKNKGKNHRFMGWHSHRD